MTELPPKSAAAERAWITVVQISAGIIIRDHGDDAYGQARQLAQQAQLERNDLAVRLWNAVADEIAKRRAPKLQ
ncbi:hypothetical protein [Bosea sp. AAP35]|uniref:hypothetical protein n=1 Tax=Bosea sp. AAP35 TaxID=1523417 RepID=UPI0012E121B8|nr:hypothetical protein [Bosea sp. AAP35]